jgi:methylated-DNA-[protein]-cysteine S-methyltransferase
MPLSQRLIPSPIGTLTLVASDTGLVAILWQNDRPRRVVLPATTEDPTHPILLETERQLSEYFSGQRDTFTVSLDMRGTPFQKEVWNLLQSIPYGSTMTYGEIARHLNRPTATRAVGAANGRNPVSIIVPCHRVIGSTGKLTGFAGGLEAKAHLLNLEGANKGKKNQQLPLSEAAAIGFETFQSEPVR